MAQYLTIEDSSDLSAVSNVIELKRPGLVGFSMENTSLGQTWDMKTAANGGFLVSNVCVPRSKLQINFDGKIFIGGWVFDLKLDGTMSIAGNSML